jgi:putative transposase
MPARNVIKSYVSEGYYHLYNRCPEGQTLFKTERDYAVFMRLLKRYLAPENKIDPLTHLNNPSSVSDIIDLVSFSLMPTHFHFLVKQHSSNGITKFSRAIITSYALYYKNTYDHHGSLFQGKLRGILIEGESYLLHLSRYIHRNALPLLLPGTPLGSYLYSSYANFIGRKRDTWIKPGEILNYFSKKNRTLSYQSFVEEEQDYVDYLTGITLEE